MKFTIRDLVPKRRWFQFNLRTLFVVLTLFCVGSAWWNHRSFCLEQIRFHADRNESCARRVFHGIVAKDDLTSVEGVVSFGGSTDGWGYLLQVSPTSSGYRRWTVTLEADKTPPISEQQIKTEMDREAELADQYFHALWRPWERLWIEDRQTATPPTP
ncbi:MAG: hypothetical protein ACKVP0_24330 [Pirellulaceae bacterium]